MFKNRLQRLHQSEELSVPKLAEVKKTEEETVNVSELSSEQLAELKKQHGWYSDEEVTALIQEKDAGFKAQRAEEIRLSQLSADERKQATDKALLAELETLRWHKKEQELRSDARTELLNHGLGGNDELLDLVIGQDGSQTLAKIKTVKNLLEETAKEREAEVKAELKASHYPSFKASKQQQVDRQGILAIKDRAERLAKIAEHKGLFPELN